MPTNKNIESPEKLYELFEKYITACKANPKKESIWSHKLDKQVTLDRETPLTWDGFDLYLRKAKILACTDDYRYNKEDRYTEYANIIRVIGQEIYNDKYSGAAAGVFNANIIARDLGLSEKTEVKGDVNINPKQWVKNKPE